MMDAQPQVSEETITHEHEHESTWVLSDVDAARIALSELATGPRTTLHNVYFDDESVLLEKGGTLRVRYEVGPPRGRVLPGKVTLKLTRDFDGAVRRADELTGRVYVVDPPSDSTWSDPFWPRELRTHMVAAGVRRLRRLGTLVVVRTRCTAPDLGHFDLDAVLLPDGTILHEVEIEQADPAAHARFVAWLLDRAPTAQRSTLSKHERFRRSTGV